MRLTNSLEMALQTKKEMRIPSESITFARKISKIVYDLFTSQELNMYDIFIKTHFSGAHHLRNYPGDCENQHGHNWKVDVTVRATKLDECGMGIDFKVLKKVVKEVIDKLDHHDLNELPYFQEINPSSEHISEFIFAQVKSLLSSERYSLFSVTVMETDTQGLTYYGK